MTEREELENLLWDWKWRVCSWELYKIKDKNWKVVPFLPNKYQLFLLENLHNRNIILKARQLGFSTLIQILLLDQALFNDNVSCWVIAQWLKEAKSIFNNKVKFAYENLPEWLKELRPLISNSKDTLEFNNGSSFVVSVSFRWWTLQYLHISEYWKICAKFPERAREINTWALESVWSENYIFIESTWEWKSGDFFEKTKKAEELALSWKKLNELEYKFFFFPWWEVEEYRINDKNIILTSETLKYFEILENDYGIKCDEEQKRWYQLKKDDKKDDMFREYPSVSEESFKVAVEWSYYRKWINIAIKEQRLCFLPYDNSLPLYAWMDLWWAGGWDDMVVWFFQIFWKEIRFIDYFCWTWFSMRDLHSEILSQKPYKYEKIFMPFDAKVHSQNDWKTREETMKELGYKVEVLEKWGISDRIALVRDNFKYCFFDNKNCSVWVDTLWEYRRKWNESIWDFLNSPEHQNSHSADAFWYSMIWALSIISKNGAKKIENEKPVFFNKMTGSLVNNFNGFNNKYWLWRK